MQKWQCIICGFIYDEEIGLPDEGIAAGGIGIAFYADLGGRVMNHKVGDSVECLKGFILQLI